MRSSVIQSNVRCQIRQTNYWVQYNSTSTSIALSYTYIKHCTTMITGKEKEWNP